MYIDDAFSTNETVAVLHSIYFSPCLLSEELNK